MVVAAVLVIGIVITGCGEVEPTEYWHTPVAEGDELIEFKITGYEAYSDVALAVVTTRLRIPGLTGSGI
jgi:hypothetical protein